jgi:hypothetical protein
MIIKVIIQFADKSQWCQNEEIRQEKQPLKVFAGCPRCFFLFEVMRSKGHVHLRR